MIEALAFAGDILQGATALAGLMVVFVGNAVTNFQAYSREQQTSVRSTFKQRAWFGFWGVVLALIAATLAVLAKWSNSNGLAMAAVMFFLFALVWAGICAWSTAREIN